MFGVDVNSDDSSRARKVVQARENEVPSATVGFQYGRGVDTTAQKQRAYFGRQTWWSLKVPELNLRLAILHSHHAYLMRIIPFTSPAFLMTCPYCSLHCSALEIVKYPSCGGLRRISFAILATSMSSIGRFRSIIKATRSSSFPPFLRISDKPFVVW